MLFLLMQAHHMERDMILMPKQFNLFCHFICNFFMHMYRDTTIPEEKPVESGAEGGSGIMSKSIPKRGEQQYIMVKTSPKSRSRNNGSQQTRGLLAHSSDSDDASDNDAKEKLMKTQQQKKTKKNFSVGSDDDEDFDETSRIKRS